jgi:hypothetical protein
LAATENCHPPDYKRRSRATINELPKKSFNVRVCAARENALFATQLSFLVF